MSWFKALHFICSRLLVIYFALYNEDARTVKNTLKIVNVWFNMIYITVYHKKFHLLKPGY